MTPNEVLIKGSLLRRFYGCKTNTYTVSNSNEVKLTYPATLEMYPGIVEEMYPGIVEGCLELVQVRFFRVKTNY